MRQAPPSTHAQKGHVTETHNKMYLKLYILHSKNVDLLSEKCNQTYRSNVFYVMQKCKPRYIFSVYRGTEDLIIGKEFHAEEGQTYGEH